MISYDEWKSLRENLLGWPSNGNGHAGRETEDRIQLTVADELTHKTYVSSGNVKGLS